jgi:putative flippase GtrA
LRLAMQFPANSTMRQLVRFLVVGGIATLFNSVIFYGLIQIGVHYRWSMMTGFIAGASLAYLLNSRFTFHAAGWSLMAAIRYLAVNLFSLLVGVAFLSGLVEGLGCGLLLAGFLVICLTTCLNFLGSRLLVFSKR